jgi:riboflavin kinase / FMN adenylyltransferase
MDVIRKLDDLPSEGPRAIATIGNFDGVHLGHRALMIDLVERCRFVAGVPAVVTFQPHPLQVLAPGNAPRQIQTLPQKLATLERLGIRRVVVIPFDRKLARMSARDFAVGILWERVGASEVYVGPNFAFGHRREGSFNLLKEIGEEKGFFVGKIPQVQFRGSRVSSTAVRQALMAGQVALARRLIGRPFSLCGRVVHGTATGDARLAIPTANLDTPNELIPRGGVYVTATTWGGRRYRSVTNFGVRPTVTGAGAPLSIETHLLDFRGDLYGQQINVEFLAHLRDERRFAGLDALAAQIGKDVARARRYFRAVEAAAPQLLAENADFAAC